MGGGWVFNWKEYGKICCRIISNAKVFVLMAEEKQDLRRIPLNTKQKWKHLLHIFHVFRIRLIRDLQGNNLTNNLIIKVATSTFIIIRDLACAQISITLHNPQSNRQDLFYCHSTNPATETVFSPLNLSRSSYCNFFSLSVNTCPLKAVNTLLQNLNIRVHTKWNWEWSQSTLLPPNVWQTEPEPTAQII
jgi:hypothetical protein